MDLDTTRRAVTQGYGTIPRDLLPEVVAERLEVLGHLAPGTISTCDESPNLAMQIGCQECRRSNQPRWLCLQCAHGETVLQRRHYETMVCLRHRRWTAPGTPPEWHTRIDHPDLITAEQNFESHHLGHCPTNVLAAQEIASDWGRHIDPRIVACRRQALPIGHLPDRIQDAIITFPEAVAIMMVFANSAWLDRILQETSAHADIRAAVDQRIRNALPERPERAVAMVMRKIKPAIAHYFHTQGPYRRYHDYPANRAIPIWHHDVDFALT
ncbi:MULTISPECIES: hypothetical protein [Gordonia]|uniref:hypothetical protein n=1 Tax=Gordonia TaxID=2053 RepID=UPI0012E73C6A|nr:hypothetical protein [Gordonia sp. 852002-51296_SCH5728562-b]